jgi:FkbM family methyltransferase
MASLTRRRYNYSFRGLAMAGRILDQVIEESAAKFGFIDGYETDQLRRLSDLLEGSDRFIDIGANRGLFSWVANELGLHREIILIEADPALGRKLQTEVTTWPSGNSITVIPCAVGDRDDTLSFNIGSEDTVGTFVKSDFTAVSAVAVAVKPLDLLVEPREKTVLKMDVEGFEYRVLLGAKRHLAIPDCRILIEIHGWGDQEINKYPFDVLLLLYRLGFAPTRCGAAHYLFEREPFAARTIGFLKCGPTLFAKGIIRRFGARDAIYRMLSRLGIRRKLVSGIRRPDS